MNRKRLQVEYGVRLGFGRGNQPLDLSAEFILFSHLSALKGDASDRVYNRTLTFILVTGRLNRWRRQRPIVSFFILLGDRFDIVGAVLLRGRVAIIGKVAELISVSDFRHVTP